MILAVGAGQRPFVLNRPIPEKEAVLSAMVSFEPNACVEGYDMDYATGEAMYGKPGRALLYGDLLWTSEQIYNFEKHDLVLNPSFCSAILELVSVKHG